MRVLVVGSGGREHALVWALSRSPHVEGIACAPGNGGIGQHARLVPIPADALDALVAHAREARYDLVVIGPEGPLVAGLADRLREAGLCVFGPSAAAAALEGSKVFAKRFMQRHGIPTAPFEVLESSAAARAYLERRAPYPCVIKADGLAAGKGAVVVREPEEAVRVAAAMLEGRAFGDAGRRIVVERFLDGREASFFVLSDGERFVELATCQDYKRAETGDRGPNTGGMGAYSPSVHLDGVLCAAIRERIVTPTLRGLREEGVAYSGVLYVGLMLTAEGPYVLEFNARFGDPETQVLLPRLDGDWLPLLWGCARGELGDTAPRWREEAAVCVVMASGGYPGRYETGKRIAGLEEVARSLPDVLVFHAGTARAPDGGFLTAGGRVLGVTALGKDWNEARERAYEAVARIRWDEAHYRRDIAADAVRVAAARASSGEGGS